MAHVTKAAAVGCGSTLFTVPSGVACLRQPGCSSLTPTACRRKKIKRGRGPAVTTDSEPGLWCLSCSAKGPRPASSTLNVAAIHCDVIWREKKIYSNKFLLVFYLSKTKPSHIYSFGVITTSDKIPQYIIHFRKSSICWRKTPSNILIPPTQAEMGSE